jgi:hypothetical protein
LTPPRLGYIKGRTRAMTAKKTDLRQVNIQLPSKLHKRLKIRAIRDDRSMSEIIALLVQDFLAGKVKLPPKPK